MTSQVNFMPDICGFMPMDKIIKGVLVTDALSLAGVQPPPSTLKVCQPGVRVRVFEILFRERYLSRLKAVSPFLRKYRPISPIA